MWHKILLDVADNKVQSWQVLRFALWEMVSFHRWGCEVRDIQTSQISEGRARDLLGSETLQGKQSLSNHNLWDTDFGYRCKKIVSPEGEKILGVGCLSERKQRWRKGGGKVDEVWKTERSSDKRCCFSVGKLLAGILIWSSLVFLLNSIPNYFM